MPYPQTLVFLGVARYIGFLSMLGTGRTSAHASTVGAVLVVDRNAETCFQGFLEPLTYTNPIAKAGGMNETQIICLSRDNYNAGDGLIVGGITSSSRADSLYVGDIGDGTDAVGQSTVKRYDAQTGEFQSVFVTGDSSGTGPGEPIRGVRGLIFSLKGELLVTNQNINQPQNGTILRYNGTTGASAHSSRLRTQTRLLSLAALYSGKILFVTSQNAEDGADDGKLRAYTKEGEFISELKAPPGSVGHFHPRGVVIGPDDLLYVSNAPNAPDASGFHQGQILRYNPKTRGFKDVFTSDANYSDFNLPDGLAFGPDGNIYVTSFQGNSSDTDKILVFAGPNKAKPGAFLYQIDLDQVGANRAVAHSLLFGPGGRLYVPILHPSDFSPGEIRRYNVLTNTFPKPFDLLVSPGITLTSPYYMTFGKTDPATLSYRGE
jgi:hypothetical protein